MEDLHARPHRHQVGGNIEGIGHHEGDKEHGEDATAGPAEALDGQLTKTGSGRQGRAVTRLLDCDHQWPRQQRRPQEGQAVLGPGLGIGGDPGRVIVGRPGDQPGPMALRYWRHTGPALALVTSSSEARLDGTASPALPVTGITCSGSVTVREFV